MKLADVQEAYKKLTNRTLDTNKLYKMVQNGGHPSISYQKFCLLVAENYTTDGYDIYSDDGSVNFSAFFWTSALLKTRYLFKSFVVNPINEALGICIVWIFFSMRSFSTSICIAPFLLIFSF